MSDDFQRTGALTDLTSYPTWAQDVIDDCASARRRVVEHALFGLMRDARLERAPLHAFLSGIWPVIDQFPQYMAMNLVKVQYGRTRGHDAARRYLIRNIRVEQNHADHWIDWAAASGLGTDGLFHGEVPSATRALSHWCWHTCERDSLAAAMAATNHAIEGATGEWATLVCAGDAYEQSFDPAVRRKAMKWLKLHAHYDDTHPWEALEIVCSVMGTDPTTRGISLIRSCIRTSYDYMALALDACIETGRGRTADAATPIAPARAPRVHREPMRA